MTNSTVLAYPLGVLILQICCDEIPQVANRVVVGLERGGGVAGMGLGRGARVCVVDAELLVDRWCQREPWKALRIR